jgi:hypothetical protein
MGTTQGPSSLSSRAIICEIQRMNIQHGTFLDSCMKIFLPMAWPDLVDRISSSRGKRSAVAGDHE